MSTRKSEVFSLDQFFPPQREIEYQGDLYAVADISFKEFLYFAELQDRVTDGGAKENMELQIDTILQIVPGMNREMLESMPLPLIVQLFAYLMNVLRDMSNVDEVEAELEAEPVSADQGNGTGGA